MQNHQSSAVQLRLITGGADSSHPDMNSSGVRYKVDAASQPAAVRHGRVIDLSGQAILPGLERAVANSTTVIINDTRQALLPGFNKQYDYNDVRNFSSTSAAFANFAQRVISGTSNIAVVDKVKDFPTQPLTTGSRFSFPSKSDRLDVENLELPAEELGDPELDSFLRSAPDRKMALVIDEKLRLIDHLDELSLQESDRIEQKRRYDETVQYRGSRLKNLGKALVGAVKSVVTAVPKAIDALLPNSIQVTPKIEIFEGLRRQKQEALKDLQLDYEKDIREIGSSYDAIAKYVRDNYNKSLPRFDTNDALMLNNLMVECKFEEDSPHYKAVQAIVSDQTKRRTEQYNTTVQELLINDGAQQNMDEMLKNSWLLRTREKMINAVTPAKKTPVSQSALRKPSINSVNPNTTNFFGNGGGGGEPPKTPDDRKFWAGASVAIAGVVALAIGVLVGPNQNQRLADESSSASGSANNNGNPETIPTTRATNSEPEQAQLQEDHQQPAPIVKTPVVKEPVKEVTIPYPVTVKSVPVEHKNPVTAEVKIPPQIHRQTVVATPKVTPEKPTAEQKTSVEEKQTPVEENQIKTLTAQEKIAELRLVEAKVSAYQRRLSEIEVDAKQLAPLIAKRSIALHLETVPALLDSVLTRMKSLETSTDLEKVNETTKSIDQIMAEAETTVTLVNVAEAMVPQGHAQTLLEETKQLAGSPNARFSIIHNGHPGSNPSVEQYEVNLAEIQSKLTKLNQSLQNHEGMTLYQSRMARLDAQYWVGYLKFVNWNLQYDKVQVVTSK